MSDRLILTLTGGSGGWGPHINLAEISLLRLKRCMEVIQRMEFLYILLLFCTQLTFDLIPRPRVIYRLGIHPYLL